MYSRLVMVHLAAPEKLHAEKDCKSSQPPASLLTFLNLDHVGQTSGFECFVMQVIPTHSHLDVEFGATEPTCLAHALEAQKQKL